jgi:hypothetical protein
MKSWRSHDLPLRASSANPRRHQVQLHPVSSEGERSGRAADRDREVLLVDDDVHAVLLLVDDDRRDLAGANALMTNFAGSSENRMMSTRSPASCW